jgi:hypothetical protein
VRNAFIHVFTLCFFAISLTFCSSKKKTPEAPPPVVAEDSAPSIKTASVESTVETEEDELIEKYSLIKLNAAATALNVIATQKEDDRQQVLTCDIESTVAKSSLPALKAMIEKKIEEEREEYVAEPPKFSKTRGFDTCGSQCGCGALVSVIEQVKPADLGSEQWQKDHARDLTRLKKKASLQNAPESLTCARRQNWYCDSDLKAFLEKPSAKK